MKKFVLQLKQGFTILEFLLVLVIMSVLTVAISTNFSRKLDREEVTCFWEMTTEGRGIYTMKPVVLGTYDDIATNVPLFIEQQNISPSLTETENESDADATSNMTYPLIFTFDNDPYSFSTFKFSTDVNAGNVMIGKNIFTNIISSTDKSCNNTGFGINMFLRNIDIESGEAEENDENIFKNNTFVGKDILINNSNVEDCTIIGVDNNLYSNQNNSQIKDKIYIGYQAAYNSDDADKSEFNTGSIVIGNQSNFYEGAYREDGSKIGPNIVIGHDSLKNTPNTSLTVAIGNNVGQEAANMSDSCLIGSYINCFDLDLKSSMLLNHNTYIGYYIFKTRSGGIIDEVNRDSQNNVVIGSSDDIFGSYGTNGSYNIVNGCKVAYDGVDGSFNIISGSNTPLSVVGNRNILFGVRQKTRINGSDNIIFDNGSDSFREKETDRANITLTGDQNVILGCGVLDVYYNMTINNNVIIGPRGGVNFLNDSSNGNDVNELNNNIFILRNGHALTDSLFYKDGGTSGGVQKLINKTTLLRGSGDKKVEDWLIISSGADNAEGSYTQYWCYGDKIICAGDLRNSILYVSGKVKATKIDPEDAVDKNNWPLTSLLKDRGAIFFDKYANRIKTKNLIVKNFDIKDVLNLKMLANVSDRRLKNVLAEFKSAREIIKNIKLYDFSYLSDFKRQKRTGVIAQELQKVLPEAVQEFNGKLYIKTDCLFFAFIKSVSELSFEILKIENQNRQLEKRISELENFNKGEMK